MKKEDLQRLIQASVVVIDPVVKEKKQVEEKEVIESTEEKPAKKSKVAFTGSFSSIEKEPEIDTKASH